jgi:hypothetical protein
LVIALLPNGRTRASAKCENINCPEHSDQNNQNEKIAHTTDLTAFLYQRDRDYCISGYFRSQRPYHSSLVVSASSGCLHGAGTGRTLLQLQQPDQNTWSDF